MFGLHAGTHAGTLSGVTTWVTTYSAITTNPNNPNLARKGRKDAD